jgi:hypothetical protein
MGETMGLLRIRKGATSRLDEGEDDATNSNHGKRQEFQQVWKQSL